MKLDLERGSGNIIRRYSPGELLVGEQIYRQPVIIAADHIIAGWSPEPIGRLRLTDLEPALQLQPEIILLGTGLRQLFPPAAVTTGVLDLGIGIEVMNTAAACRTFNILATEYRRVVAALIIG